MRKILAGCTVMLALVATERSGHAGETAVRLAPHRVVYELSLLSSRGARSIESARGRIAYEFTGDACQGYRLKYRQVTAIDNAETGTKMSDLRTSNFESGDGRTFSFRNDTRIEGTPDGTVEGSAEHEPAGPLAVRLRKPKRQTFKLDPAAVFPNLQMRELIEAARAGKTLLSMKVFDGSDNGHTVYDTLAIIGRRIDPSSGGWDRGAGAPGGHGRHGTLACVDQLLQGGARGSCARLHARLRDVRQRRQPRAAPRLR